MNKIAPLKYAIVFFFCFIYAATPAQTHAIRKAARAERLKQKKTNAAASVDTAAGALNAYKAQVVSTNFTIPIVRINVIDKHQAGAPADRKTNVSLFNSVGAGIGYYWGRMEQINDVNGVPASTKFYNTFGLQTGFLFAANTGDSTHNGNIFAWTVSVSMLNFQVGYGYEFGTVEKYTKRGFFTLSYNIPVSELVKGAFYLVKRSAALSPGEKNKGLLKLD